ncbi:MAG TPA: BatA and WFA domain-containing protein [Vicinamibacterales bacterium]
MSFLYPAFLLGALAIAVPVILHLLRRDVAPELPFTAVRLLKKSPVERSRRRRLRDLLLLAARVTALALLAAAFARPFFAQSASAMLPLRIVAIDRSFSMAAPGTFDRALELARAAIDDAGVGARVAVLAFDDRASVVAEPGGAGEARNALEGLGPSYGATRYAAAISRAAELAAGGPARLIVITDLQRAGWEGESRLPAPASLQVEVRDAGAPAMNVAVSDVRTTGDGVVVGVRNASDQPRTGPVVLRHDGREAARATYTIPGNTSVDVAIDWTPAPGSLAVTIEDEGGFPADDSRHLAIDESGSSAVMIIASPDAPGFYVQRALDAANTGDVTTLRAVAVAPAQIAAGRAGSIAKQRALVLLTTRGLDRAAREGIAAFVRSGGGLLIAASPDVESSVVATIFGWPAKSFQLAEARRGSLTATDVRHPIFRPFGAFAANLGNVRFARAWRVDGSGWYVPARFDDGSPAVLERREGEGRVVLFASDLDRRWNDFPLHPAYVPFVTETVRHIASRTIERDTFLVGRVPAAVSAEPGVHRLESGRVVTVNVDPRESSTSVMSPEEFTAMLEPVDVTEVDGAVKAEQLEARQSLWQYGLMLMLGVLIVESFVGKV